jgi:DnaJ like chaperone protein
MALTPIYRQSHMALRYAHGAPTVFGEGNGSMKILLIVLAILYALSPYDILPDFLIGWGWLDDLVILGLLGRYLYRLKRKKNSFQYRYQESQRSYKNDTRQGFSGKKSYAGNTRDEDETYKTDAYAVLGVERNASVEEIKKAYRQLVNRYHPDKVAHLGDEFKELAEKRFKEIQQAYQELKLK